MVRSSFCVITPVAGRRRLSAKARAWFIRGLTDARPSAASGGQRSLSSRKSNRAEQADRLDEAMPRLGIPMKATSSSPWRRPLTKGRAEPLPAWRWQGIRVNGNSGTKSARSAGMHGIGRAWRRGSWGGFQSMNQGTRSAGEHPRRRARSSGPDNSCCFRFTLGQSLDFYDHRLLASEASSSQRTYAATDFFPRHHVVCRS